MSDIGTFPFGQPIKKVVQKDRTQKRIFVLGVYARRRRCSKLAIVPKHLVPYASKS
jgi:hypothetical protein